MNSQVILAIVELFLYFSLGAFSARIHLIKDNEIDRWSGFIAKVVYPLYIFQTMLLGFIPADLKELWTLPFIGIGMMLLGALGGWLTKAGLKNRTKELERSYINISAMNNYAFLPIILVERLWGAEGLAQFFVMALGLYFCYWTLGIVIIGGHSGKEIIKHVFNPCFIAILSGAILKFFHADQWIPSVGIAVCKKLGGGAVPFILTLIGANLYYSIFRLKKEKIYNLIYFAFFRNLAYPALFILILWALPLPEQVFKISAIVAVMPSSTMSSVLSRIYKADSDFTSQAALVTHLVGLITIPLSLILLKIY